MINITIDITIIKGTKLFAECISIKQEVKMECQ